MVPVFIRSWKHCGTNLTKFIVKRDKQNRTVKIERLIVKRKDAFTRVVGKNEELFDLAQKTEDPDAACKSLEKGL